MFKLSSDFLPTGDQPEAIKKLTDGIQNNFLFQTLLGVTGSGKTFTMASVIEKAQRPALVISPNKTLAAQLYQEFREFFPHNSVHYFVSYYDYYQPEAYLPTTDTYIEKDARINEVLDQLRHVAVSSVLTRRDFIVIASVSCIYNLGDPKSYEHVSFEIKKGATIKSQELIKQLVALQYDRKEVDPRPGNFAYKLNILTVYPPTGEHKIEIYFKGQKIEKISQISLKESKELFKIINLDLPYKLKKTELSAVKIFPAKFFLTEQDKLQTALFNIRQELKERLKIFEQEKKFLEMERLKRRVNYDLAMIQNAGYTPGIENYSRHFEFRKPGQPPFTLLDYLPQGTLLFIDESHLTVPQIRAMAVGDRQRKETLVEYGFRLPSAIDNRPLTFSEFLKKPFDAAQGKKFQTIFVSATPGHFEKEKLSQIAEQLIRPTGILDPKITVRPAKNQIKNLVKEIKSRIKKKQRVLVTTITKRLAEDIVEYLLERGIKAHYLHADIKTLRRPEILKGLRLGEFNVIVGINLLREGLDLPEVTLVAILDADREGFLRGETSLIQTMGRASRNIKGEVILYADNITSAMKAAIKEIERRRKIQEEYNKTHGIVPKSIVKPIREDIVTAEKGDKEASPIYKALIKELEISVKTFDFKKAAKIREKLLKFQK